MRGRDGEVAAGVECEWRENRHSEAVHNLIRIEVQGIEVKRV